MKIAVFLALFFTSAAAFAPVLTHPRGITTLNAKSQALPFIECPEKLDGSMIGDVGFDPLRISDTLPDLTYARAAEIKHGRIAQLAVVGMLVEEKFHLPQFASIDMNPLKAVPQLGVAACSQIFLTLAIIELTTLAKTYSSDTPWDLGLGTKNLAGKSAKQIETLQLQELKHGRLAMIAFTGQIFHTFLFGSVTGY